MRTLRQWRKKLKKTLEDGKPPVAVDWKNNLVKMAILPKAIQRFNIVQTKNLYRYRKNNLKMSMAEQVVKDDQSNPEQK